MILSRRQFVGLCAGASAAPLARVMAAIAPTQPGSGRTFHLSISANALEANPDLLTIVRSAGVTDLWLVAFLNGRWHCEPDRIQQWRERITRTGMDAHVINVPLGHPGDSLGTINDEVRPTRPGQWRAGVHADGTRRMGTSLHPPATEENARALRRLQDVGVDRVFLDDDFRLAPSPGVVGGCFCDDHRERFLTLHGYGSREWTDLLTAVRNRRLTSTLREWVEFTCDELTACFKAQQQAAPRIRLGIMVMYFGAEKAGVRLADYRDVPLRVGELMFDDTSFAPIKNKTAELFSVLFHRRFVSPENAWSETTAFPADRLSARNMAGKLATSTISDVRNTMFMSGLTPFPAAHWQTLGPAMKKHVAIHREIAGHTMRGPFKHYWGEPSRFVGDDNPNSLFLASGIPFEVMDEPARDGWTFLSDFDARAVPSGGLRSRGTIFVCRPGAGAQAESLLVVPESLPELFALKRKLAPQLGNVPFVEEDKPAVCAWYPSAEAVLLWNPAEQRETFTIRFGRNRRQVFVDGLDIELVRDMK